MANLGKGFKRLGKLSPNTGDSKGSISQSVAPKGKMPVQVSTPRRASGKVGDGTPGTGSKHHGVGEGADIAKTWL